MTRLLLVYATSKGLTAHVAEHLAARFRDNGFGVDACRVPGIPPEVDPGSYDAVVAGGPIYFDRHPAPLLSWLRHHSAALDGRPLALFTVCMSVLDGGAGARRKVAAYTAALVQAAGQPAETAVFGGALHYRAYNPLLRWVIRRLSKGLAGQVPDDPTDTSRDHVYTDWHAVDAFAAAFAAQVRARVPAAADVAPDLA